MKNEICICADCTPCHCIDSEKEPHCRWCCLPLPEDKLKAYLEEKNAVN